MQGNNKKAIIISALFAFFVVSYVSVWNAVTSGSFAFSEFGFTELGDRNTYQIFKLFDYELKNDNPNDPGPTSNTQTKVYIIDAENDAGSIKGQAVVTTTPSSTRYQLAAQAIMRQDPTPGQKYMMWLQSRTGQDSITVGESNTATITVSGFESTRDLSSYNVIVSQESSARPPTRPTLPIIQTQQRIQVGGDSDGDSGGRQVPTRSPDNPTPTETGQPAPTVPGGTGETGGDDPTATPGGGEQGEDVDAKIQSAINAVQESNIRTYLQELTDSSAPPENDGAQTRFTGTSGNDEEAQYIKSHFESLSLDAELQPFTVGRTSSNNIIGRLYGTDRDNWYLMTAHMDSTSEDETRRAPGADDNGSGTSAVMEVARAIASSGITLDKSIEFVLFSGEERFPEVGHGLNGSQHYVRNIPAGKNILGVINYDMVGHQGQSDCVDFLYSPTYGGNLITEELERIDTEFGIGLGGRSTSSGYKDSSDHYSFMTANPPILAMIAHECEFSSRYHTTGDTTDFINFSQITKAAKAAAGALVSMSHSGLGQGVIRSQNAADILNEKNLHTNTSTSATRDGSTHVPEDTNVLGTTDPDAPLLVLVKYTDPADLDRIYAFADNPIKHYHNEDINPFFLGLFNESSYDAITEAGFDAVILDSDTDLELYGLYWHPRPGNGDLLAEEGTVTTLSENLFLVKHPSIASRNDHHSGNRIQFFDEPLPTGSNPPPFNTARITAVPSGPLETAAGETARGFRQTILVVFALAVLGIGGIGAYTYFKKRSE